MTFKYGIDQLTLQKVNDIDLNKTVTNNNSDNDISKDLDLDEFDKINNQDDDNTKSAENTNDNKKENDKYLAVTSFKIRL
jgi:hypothetical protein